MHRSWNPKTLLTAFLVLTALIVQGSIFWYTYNLDRQRKSTETPYIFPVIPADSSEYAQLADTLLQKNIFSLDTAPPYTPFSMWPIGYPAFLATAKALTGSFIGASLIQLVLFVITIILLFQLSERVLPLSLAWIPSFLFSVDPAVAFYNISIHTDGLFLSLIFASLYILVLKETKPNKTLLALAGILLGGATLLRPIAQFLPFVILPWLIYLQKDSPKIRLQHAAIVLASFFIVIIPWMARNKHVTGTWTIADIGAKNLLSYNARDFLISEEERKARETQTNRSTADIRQAVNARIETDLAALQKARGGRKESGYSALALRYIGEHPLRYAKFHFIGTLPYFFAGSTRHYLMSLIGPFQKRAELPYTQHDVISQQFISLLVSKNVGQLVRELPRLSIFLAEIAGRALLLALAILAAILQRKKYPRLILSLWGTILYFAVLTGPVSFTRYRIVTDPYLLLLATMGAWELYMRGRKRKHAPTPISATT